MVEEGFEWRLSEYPEDPLSFDLAMPHGAISRDGKFIAIGSQDSSHLVFNENYEQIADIGNQSEYPHYTLFSQDNTMLAMNSCHFYNGCTIGVKTAILEGLETEPYKDDERVVVLNESARVYAGVSRNGEFIIGDASGYIRAMDETGKLIWQLFLGSSIGDMDISEDGKFLLVSTYAGFLAKYDLDSAEKAPHQIGSGSQRELFRWVFWKGEKPLLW